MEIESSPKIDKEFSDYYIKKMTMYIDNAKSYIQIATGSLIIPITFHKQLLGQKDSTPFMPDNYLVCSWFAFAIAIGSGLFYQYLAVKRVETRVEKTHARFFDKRPQIFYFIMLVTFYIGTILFVISANCRLSQPHGGNCTDSKDSLSYRCNQSQ
jgi:hypothetical protein